MGLLDLFTGKTSPDKFARIMIDAIRRASVDDPIEYDEQRFLLKIGSQMMQLGNAYADYCKAPRRDRAKVIEAYLPIATEQTTVSEVFDEAKPHLLPKVREPAFYGLMKLRGELDGYKFPISEHRPISPFHTVEIIYDLPQSVASVPNDRYVTWGVSFDEALNIARDNLWKISNEPFEQPVPGFHVSPWADAHDASRLFLHDLIWQLPVKGRHVAMTPCRDRLLIAGSGDEPVLALMAAMAKDLFSKDTRPMSGHAVVLDGTQWKGFLPDASSASYQDFRLLGMMSDGRDYDEQKQLLESLHEKRHEDIFVASLTVTQDTTTGAYSSYTVWPDGIDTMLPKAERIAFMSNDGKTVRGMVPWDTVRREVGALMQKKDVTPARYRVQTFPTPAQIAAMDASGR